MYNMHVPMKCGQLARHIFSIVGRQTATNIRAARKGSDVHAHALDVNKWKKVGVRLYKSTGGCSVCYA